MTLRFIAPLLLASSLLLAKAATGSNEESPVIKVAPITNAPVLKDAEIGAAIESILSRCDRVVIKPHKGDPRTLDEKRIIQGLGAVLGKAVYQKKSHCLCISYPSYSFYQGTTLEMRITFHHGYKIRAYGDNVCGDYEIGAPVVKAFLEAAREQ